MTEKQINSFLENVESKQKEMHDFIDWIIVEGEKRGKTVDYKDAKSMFFLFKMTELENKINRLTNLKRRYK